MFATTARTHYPPSATWRPVQIPPMCPASPPLPPSRSSRVSSFCSLLELSPSSSTASYLCRFRSPLSRTQNSSRVSIPQGLFRHHPHHHRAQLKRREGKRAVQEKISQCCEILAKTSGTGQKNAQIKMTQTQNEQYFHRAFFK